MKRVGRAVLAITLATPAAGFAQGGGVVAPLRVPTAQGERIETVWTAAVESKTTTGRPYSAEAVTERIQLLGDGNRIEVRSMTRVFRDSEGRTRREMFNSDGTIRSIAISDPIANVSYTLDPASKQAYRTGGNVITPTLAPAGRGGTYTSAAGGEGRVLTATPVPAQGGGGGGGGGGGRGGMVAMRSPAPDNPNVRKEDLGSQNIEGVVAAGSRTTTLIPAGEIGNAREIRVVSEQWFSDELQVLVMTRHADPRSGENVYRLRNILRADPDPSLFNVPADYTIQQRGVRRPQ